MLAVILESGEPSRLYTALSLLVSTAADGEPARALVSFGALPALVAGRFEPHLAELWATARQLDDLCLWACAAAVDATGTSGDFEVMSTPRFLRETAGARLVVV
jgi:hypothetical protein